MIPYEEDDRILILAPPAQLHYFDSQSATAEDNYTPLGAWNAIMAHPLPLMTAAFWVRDQISRVFGVRKIGGFSGKSVEFVKVGDHLDFFVVEHVDDQALVLTERDRHLDVMTCVSCKGPQVTITSSVVVHNLFGRAYMIPVGIAHRWIVRRMLSRLCDSA